MSKLWINGKEVLQDIVIQDIVMQGTWSAIGTVTLPAVTFSGVTTMEANLIVGTIDIDDDSGAVVLVDMGVTADPIAGTEESVSLAIDGNTMLTLYSEADSSGAVENKKVKIVSSMLNFGTPASLTIGTGAVAVTQTSHTLVVEGGTGGGADQLDSASGGADGDILILKTSTSGGSDQVTIADGTGAGTFILAGGATFAMDNVDDRIMFLHNGTEWVEMWRSSNS